MFKKISKIAACIAALTISMALPAMAKDGEKTTQETQYKKAIFAGGCFWCVEADFDKIPGVIKTISGYTGGKTQDPTYKQVTYGNTGHYEAVEITYDPNKVTYAKLLHYFWRTVDPIDSGGQFCDRGHSYKTAIFAVGAEQLKLAEESKNKIDESKILKKPIVTKIYEAGKFYKAEGYHQDYYTKNPLRYQYYRYSCGRDDRIRRLWGDQAHGGLKKKG